MDGADFGVIFPHTLRTECKGGENVNDEKGLVTKTSHKEVSANSRVPLWIDPRDLEFFAKLQKIVRGDIDERESSSGGNTNETS
jgi:hypothetical protein